MYIQNPESNIHMPIISVDTYIRTFNEIGQVIIIAIATYICT